jgi:uncharacterized protein
VSQTREMERDQIDELLHKVGYGHLGFIHQGKPAVMSVHYYLQDPDIYLFTTKGIKTDDINTNPQVCLQVEEVRDPMNWRSATVMGTAECLTIERDIDRAIQFIKDRQPNIATEIDRSWMESWGSGSEIAIYRIDRSEMSGHTTEGVK